MRPWAVVILCLAAGAALSAFGGLLSRWCANPALGWGIAAGSAALGAAFAARRPEADADASRAWTVGGALAALAIPALLRFLGLAMADAALLQNPMGGTGRAAFVLGQAAIFTAFIGGSWTRALQSGTRGPFRGGRAAAVALVGLATGIASARSVETSVLLAAAGLAALAAAVLEERPWSRTVAPLRARAFALAAAAGLLLSAGAPHLLRDVWLARLNAAYPGGKFLSFKDDGARARAVYRFSTGATIELVDGVVSKSPTAGK